MTRLETLARSVLMAVVSGGVFSAAAAPPAAELPSPRGELEHPTGTSAQEGSPRPLVTGTGGGTGGQQNPPKPAAPWDKSPFGVYKRKVQVVIGSRWNAAMHERAVDLSPGEVQLKFEITAEGKIRNLKVLKPDENTRLAELTREAVLGAKLPPPPGDLIAVARDGVLAMQISFFLYDNAPVDDVAEAEKLLAAGKHTQALEALGRASATQPRNVAACLQRGLLYIRFKMFTRAIEDFDRALTFVERERNPWNVVAIHSKRGWTYNHLGEYAKAVRDYEATLATGIADADTIGQFAWLLATCPDDKFRDGKRAVDLASQANEKAGWKSAALQMVLAAACAETDAFDDAVHWAQIAAAARKGGRLRELCEQQVELYKAHRKFRERPTVETLPITGL